MCTVYGYLFRGCGPNKLGPYRVYRHHLRDRSVVYGIHNDACTIVWDRPRGFRFKNAGRMHDYGYLLIKRDRLAKHLRYKINLYFYVAMARVCSTYNRSVRRDQCYNWARAYYYGVQAGGAIILSSVPPYARSWWRT
ncbi:MAG: phospholipase A2 [Streptomycetales bacterium]